MSDVRNGNQGRGEAAAPRGPGGPGGPGGGTDSVQQVVFRWDGNHGRQGTGMNAVARSCPVERAEELGRELGPLLWVSGAAASRPSTVRALSRDGEVMLVRRWPTTDPGGRPSTVSHVLVGRPGILKTRQCLALAYAGWGTRKAAETASGRKEEVDCADLDRVALKRLPEMLERLPTVRDTLVVVTAEWLRDPAQRVSLRTEPGERRPGHPDRDEASLVYLGLFLIFGPWLGREWTFATYDAVDTHPLRLMSVPRWEPDTGGSGPLARVTGRPVSDPGVEHLLADRLVDHLLAHPEAPAGVPQLVDAFADGATWDWPRRSARLREILGTDRTGTRRLSPSPSPSPSHSDLPAPAPAPTQAPESDQEWNAAPPAPAPYSGPPYSDPHTDPYPNTCPAPHDQHHGHDYGRDRLHIPDHTPGPAPARDTSALHRELREAAQRMDPLRREVLRTELRAQPDEFLLEELRSEELPPDSVDLLLDELSAPHRIPTREDATRHALCELVLRKNLYWPPYGQPGGPVSRTAMADRAAGLFTWAVAPLARDERYLPDLRELLHRMLRDPSPTAGNWLHKAIVAPANGQAPDLPPVLWQQIVGDALRRNGGPSAALPPPATAAPAPTLRAPSAPTPERPDFTARLTEQLNKPGCVMGIGVGLIVVLIVIALLFSA
ncbi:hypothetical protein RI578_21110 [Streptomyces sp. BB1-1-1]|uniref:hypothetical protein n=1 Tax=Streptomyces sp. BB1-1-1 TaxID=3074430 RepID=UPI002877F549|nr:hypothetical protein [Streptomyces sp. BB1-1-1]WND36631.1 hypothetical protein RI578_21110 [Streptomyces sp. BB1-1-1]